MEGPPRAGDPVAEAARRRRQGLAGGACGHQVAGSLGRGLLPDRRQSDRVEAVRRGPEVAGGVAGGRAKWRQADETLLALAHAYSQANRLDTAKETVRKLIADFPESKVLDRATYRLAEYSFAGGDWKTAVADYQQVLDKWPQSPLAPYGLYGLGWAKLNQNDYAGAEKAIDALVERYGDHKLAARGRYARGMARQQLGKYAPAIDDIRAFLAADPLPAEKTAAGYVLGLCQAGLKKYAEAAATFQGLLKEESEVGHRRQGALRAGLGAETAGQGEGGGRHLRAAGGAVSRQPAGGRGPLPRGRVRLQVRRLQACGGGLLCVAGEGGQDGTGREGRPQAGLDLLPRWTILPMPQQTFAYQRATWPDGPLAADAAFMEAECLFKQKKFAAAMAAYGQVKGTAGNDFPALALLHAGQAAAQLKQWDKSLELLAKCVEQFPASACLPEALYEQGWAKQNLGKLAEALALYQQVIAKTDREVAARRSS